MKKNLTKNLLLHDNNSLKRGSRDVDVVNACSSATYNFKIFSSFDHFSRYFCCGSDNQTVIVLKIKNRMNEKNLYVTNLSKLVSQPTGISARSSSLVSFVLRSTAIPFASRMVLQQLSTLSLIKTRLRFRENAILFQQFANMCAQSLWKIKFSTCTHFPNYVGAPACCDWLNLAAIT